MLDRARQEPGGPGREGARPKERSELSTRPGRAAVPTLTWGTRRLGLEPGCGPSHPCLEFERREPGMCGMRAGMRCAQLREGAGGSGGPATSPSGRRLGCGRAGEGGRAGRGLCGRQRGRGGEVGVELADPLRGPSTLTAVFGSGLSRSTRTNFPFDSFSFQTLRAESPTLSQELNTFLYSRGPGVLRVDWARALRPAMLRVSLPTCP